MSATVRVLGSAVRIANCPLMIVDRRVFTPSAPHMRIWDRSEVFTVKADGVPVLSGFAVERPCGRLVFDAETLARITVSGAYLPSAVALIAGHYRLYMGGGVAEAPRYGDRQMRRVATEATYTGELNDVRLAGPGLHEGLSRVVLLELDAIRIWAELNRENLERFLAGRTTNLEWVGKHDADKRTAAKL